MKTLQLHELNAGYLKDLIERAEKDVQAAGWSRDATVLRECLERLRRLENAYLKNHGHNVDGL